MDATCSTLQKLKPAIKNRLLGMLSKEVIFQHDNASAHMAIACKYFLQSFRWEVLEHPRL